MGDCLDKSFANILQKAMSACAREEYCDYDIEKKIINWGASTAQIEEILACLHQQNYLCNERYAKAFCVGKNRQLKWGRIKIAYQLRMKRVEEDVIEKGLLEINEEEYDEGLLLLAQKRWQLMHDSDRYKKEGKLMTFLQSKGYEIYKIKNIVKQLK